MNEVVCSVESVLRIEMNYTGQMNTRGNKDVKEDENREAVGHYISTFLRMTGAGKGNGKETNRSY